MHLPNRWMTILIFLEFYMVCITASAFAQNRSKIFGKVIDASTREPLPSANVFLAGTAMGAVTDLKGEYQIFSVSPGTYTLRVTFIGYKHKENLNSGCIRPGT